MLGSVAPGALTLSMPLALHNVQNGAPDGMQLIDGSTVLDGLSYEGTMGGVTEGASGAVADASSTSSIGRSSTGADTDDNAADFSLASPTPGAANP
jgi:hypothetical protein